MLLRISADGNTQMGVVMLKQLLKSFLEASGYHNITEKHGGFRAELTLPGGELPFYHWPMPDSADGSRDNWPARLAMQRIAAAKAEDPSAQLIFIRDEKPIKVDWINEATALDVKIRYPIQFFDGNFSFEEAGGQPMLPAKNASRALNATSRSLALNKERRRVPQPYTVENVEESPGGGADLLEHLERELTAPLAKEDPETAKRLHVVIGPAGAGKTILFESLYASLYQNFISRKRELYDARRPFQLTPQHSSLPLGRGGQGPGFDAIFSEYLDKEFKSATQREAFTWRIQNGYGVLMLDGLDEVIATDERFFSYLLDVLFATTESWQVPKVLICLRESMKSTNIYLQDFLGQIEDVIPHSVYRLSAWGKESVDEFLRLFAPEKEIAERFRSVVEQPNLKSLTELPFYCQHLLDRVKSPENVHIQSDDSERVRSELLDAFINDYIERDRKKGLIDRRISQESLLHVLEMFAEDNYKNGYRGVEIASLILGFDALLSPEIKQDQEQHTRQIDNLTRLALFNNSSALGDENGHHAPRPDSSINKGRIHFVNDVIAEYLFSRSAREKVNRLDQLATTLSGGPELPNDGIVLRQLANELTPAQVSELVLKVAAMTNVESELDSNGVRNLLQLALLARQDDETSRDLLLKGHVRLSGQKLSSIVFTNLDLRNMDFVGADLSSAVFDNCDLTGTRLAARLHNTRFRGDATLRTLASADFGDLGRFQSAIINEETYNRNEFVGFLMTSTSEASQTLVPDFCAALEQLWILVRRFRNPDGTPHRDWHTEITILKKGTQHLGDRRPLVRELVRRNYLGHEKDRRWYVMQNRANADFAVFAQSRGDLPGGLKQVLDGVCPNCDHIMVEK